MRTTAMLTAGLFLAGALALAATQASAQGQGKSDGGQKGATSGPPQSRSKAVPSPLLPEKREAAPGAAEMPEGGDDEAARAPHTCPDRGNKLELII